jgi:hypothetical protein
MTKLLQENKEMKSHRTNCTFGFFADTPANSKKPKEHFFANTLKLKIRFNNKEKYDYFC